MSARRPRAWAVAGLALGVAALGTACSPPTLDPTEQAFAITVRNDGGQTVRLEQCDVRCDTIHERVTLAPGGTVAVNVSDAGAVSSWVVADTSGHPLGCLRLRFDHRVPGAVVDVSQMTPPPC